MGSAFGPRMSRKLKTVNAEFPKVPTEVQGPSILQPFILRPPSIRAHFFVP